MHSSMLVAHLSLSLKTRHDIKFNDLLSVFETHCEIFHQIKSPSQFEKNYIYL